MKSHIHRFDTVAILVFVFLFSLFCNKPVSAQDAVTIDPNISYQQDVGVNFTFNSALSLTLSSSDLHIYNLAPGTANDSNVINVKVLTNSVGGYTLSASVGNNSTYNTRNLKHSNSNISDVFSSINYTTSPTITSNTDLGTDKWGFSFSLDNGDNWSNYNGLPLYNATTWAVLKQTTSPITNETGDDIKFKIAAKASDTKPSGDYNNVINFTVVAAVAPVSIANAFEAAGKTQLYGYYQMQDMDSTICSSVEVENSELQVIDTRDNKVYWIAKLADGNCWMTQNLDHDIRTDTDFYTYYNTDIGHTSTPNTSATWTANRATYATGDFTWYTTSGNSIEQSYDPGDVCWDGVISNDEIQNKTVPCTTNMHYHTGNYYNWGAAVAMNNPTTYFTSADTVTPSSICPAGWTLPNPSGSKSFSYMINNYTSGNTGNLHLSPVYFVYTGSWLTEGWYGDHAFYHTSTSAHDDIIYAKSFYFDTLTGGASGVVDITDASFWIGQAIRCIAR